MDLLEAAKQKSVDGFTWQEIGELFALFLHNSVESLLDSVLCGTEKKQLILTGVGNLFDIVAPAIPLPAFFTPFRRWWRPYVKTIVLLLSDGAIEVLYSKVKRDKEEATRTTYSERSETTEQKSG